MVISMSPKEFSACSSISLARPDSPAPSAEVALRIRRPVPCTTCPVRSPAAEALRTSRPRRGSRSVGGSSGSSVAIWPVGRSGSGDPSSDCGPDSSTGGPRAAVAARRPVRRAATEFRPPHEQSCLTIPASTRDWGQLGAARQGWYPQRPSNWLSRGASRRVACTLRTASAERAAHRSALARRRRGRSTQGSWSRRIGAVPRASGTGGWFERCDAHGCAPGGRDGPERPGRATGRLGCR